MHNRFSSFSIIIIFLGLTILGFFFIPKLSVKLNPSRKQPIVNVRFDMWGQSARNVESEVTSKLEAMLNRMKGVQSIHSHSRHGGGNITIYLSEHTDPEMARFEVSTIVRQAWTSLPAGVSYPSIEMRGTSDEANYPFLRYTVNAPYSPIEIEEFVDNNIRNKLAEINGISKVDVHGAGRFIYKLEYDYNKLQNYNISTDDIRKAVSSYQTKEFLGIADHTSTNGNQNSIRISLMSKSAKDDFDPSSIQVINNEGTIIMLDKLVTVSYEEEELSSFFRINGLNSIYMSITADDQTNRLALSNTVKQLLTDMEKTFPPGYELHMTYDEGEYINAELNKIYLRSGLTIVILLIFIFIVYRNIKYSLLIIFSLISNISIAVICYYIFGIEMHLFSLAGLTISINLILDNFIIMTDQIVNQGNKKTFMAILTASLTTIGSLSIIFFLDKSIQLNLLDFAMIVIINLTVSLIVALLFVPALIDKLKLTKRKKRIRKHGKLARINKKRFIVYFNRIYTAIIIFCNQKKVKKVLMIMLILAFGIPVFLLPDKLENDNPHTNKETEKDDLWHDLYNNTFGSTFYRENIKEVVDIALGGTMRLFAQKVKNGSYSSGKRAETTLHVTASLPNGSTKDQMDALIKKMEEFLLQYKEVRQFETSIENGRRASIRIFFEKDHQRGQFPHVLYSKVISKATELGGGSWSVYGVGDGFNNEIKDQAGSSRIKLLGYNYDVLNSLANELRDSLLQLRRIKEVTIDSEFSWYKNDYTEFIFNLQKDKLVESNIFPAELYNSLIPMFQRNVHITTWNTDKSSTRINLYSEQSKTLDVWNLEHYSGRIKDRNFHLSELANIEKAQVAQSIAKEDQQYRLCLQYEYIGSYSQAHNVMNRYIQLFNITSPLGYKAETESYKHWWEEGKTSQYWLLFLIIGVIFLTTSVLFNSLKQPFIVIFIIPISFIGIFLTFYLFELNFDQGGFAAFILLTGLSINANIYILDEYNNIIKNNKGISSMKAYLRAWNSKVRPIFLTIISTVLGFIPFMAGSLKESFWFPLAAGTSGGLIVSFIALFLFLPIFMKIEK